MVGALGLPDSIEWWFGLWALRLLDVLPNGWGSGLSAASSVRVFGSKAALLLWCQALLIKCYDSVDDGSTARFCSHTTFEPSVPALVRSAFIGFQLGCPFRRLLFE